MAHWNILTSVMLIDNYDFKSMPLWIIYISFWSTIWVYFLHWFRLKLILICSESIAIQTQRLATCIPKSHILSTHLLFLSSHRQLKMCRHVFLSKWLKIKKKFLLLTLTDALVCIDWMVLLFLSTFYLFTRQKLLTFRIYRLSLNVWKINF